VFLGGDIMSEEQRGKSELEKAVEQGVSGPPEIKKDEKNRFLGEFKERVIRYLTYEQVVEPGTYSEILDAINHPQADKLIIDREVNDERARDYIDLALKNGLEFKRIDSPNFKGDVGLVVVSGEAVKTDKIQVMDRREKLKKQGISDKIIKNVGSKLCDQCWSELKEKAPEELRNYKKMNIFDKIAGVKCVCRGDD